MTYSAVGDALCPLVARAWWLAEPYALGAALLWSCALQRNPLLAAGAAALALYGAHACMF